MNKLFIFIILIFSIVISSCSDSSDPPINEDINRSGEIIQIKVVTHDTYEEVTNAWIKHNAKLGVGFDGRTRLGWAAWSIDKPYQCEIHVVKIDTTKDKELETWGHELAHCVYGFYHNKGATSDR